jgi:hypothetical protein
MLIPMQYIVRTRDSVKKIGLTTQLAIDCLAHLEGPAIFGHLVDLPKGFDIKKILQLDPAVVGVYPVQKFVIPKPIKPKAVQNVTVDDCTRELGFDEQDGPRSDPNWKGGSNIIFAIVDTGVDLTGNEQYPFQDGLQGDTSKPSRCLAHKDFMGGPPYHAHATWVARLIFASKDSSGKWGGGCDKAKFYSTQVLDPSGSGSTYSVIAGFNWVLSQNPKPHIINMSLGGPHDQLLNEAVDAAKAQGIQVYAATGNSGKYPPYCDNTVGSPADADTVVACGAASISLQNADGKRYVATFTSREPRYDGKPLPTYSIAPGVYIQPGPGDPVNSGTSFASPLSATSAGAVTSKILLVKPNLSPRQVRDLAIQLVEANCGSMGYKEKLGEQQGHCVEGNGFVQANKAYVAVGGTEPSRKGAPSAVSGAIIIHPKPVDELEPTDLTVRPVGKEFESEAEIWVQGKLYFPKDNTPLVGRTITITIGAETKTAVTDETGFVIVSFKAPTVSVDTTLNWQAAFAGD